MIKELLKNVIGLSGRYIPPVMSKLDNGLTIFGFHDVTNNPSDFSYDNDIWVSCDMFKAQMEMIGANFNIVSMDNVIKGNLPVRPAMVTFDDGYQGTFSNGLPILREMGFPSTVFINLSPILGENYWSERVSYLCGKVPEFKEFLTLNGLAASKHPTLDCTEELLINYERSIGSDYLDHLNTYISPYADMLELKETQEDPLVTIGSHLYTHYNVKNLTMETITTEYNKNAEYLNKLRNSLPVFAFPFGQPDLCFTMDQAMHLSNLGVRKLFTAWPQPNANPNGYVLDRICLTMWHKTDVRLWFQILRYPVIRTAGFSIPYWDYPI